MNCNSTNEFVTKWTKIDKLVNDASQKVFFFQKFKISIKEIKVVVNLKVYKVSLEDGSFAVMKEFDFKSLDRNKTSEEFNKLDKEINILKQLSHKNIIQYNIRN